MKYEGGILNLNSQSKHFSPDKWLVKSVSFMQSENQKYRNR